MSMVRGSYCVQVMTFFFGLLAEVAIPEWNPLFISLDPPLVGHFVHNDIFGGYYNCGQLREKNVLRSDLTKAGFTVIRYCCSKVKQMSSPLYLSYTSNNIY